MLKNDALYACFSTYLQNVILLFSKLPDNLNSGLMKQVELLTIIMYFYNCMQE